MRANMDLRLVLLLALLENITVWQLRVNKVSGQIFQPVENSSSALWTKSQDCIKVQKKKQKVVVLCPRPPQNVKLGVFKS